MIDFDKMEKEQEQKTEQEPKKAVALNNMTDKSIADVSLSDIHTNMTDKSIDDISLSDIHFKLDTTQSYEEQAKDVVNATAIAKAVKDKNTVEILAKGKQNELIGEQQAKITKTKKDLKDSETELQKSEFDSNKTLFDTFNIVSHLPKWLQMIVVPLLTPFYLIGVLVIKVPCGFVRMLIDGVDGIICRYEKADERTRPRIKVTVWIIFGLAVAGAITLGVLGGLKII